MNPERPSPAAPEPTPSPKSVPRWTRHEKAELVLIPCIAAIMMACSNFLPSSFSIGEATLYAAAALLFQSLIRYLALLAKAKSLPLDEPKRTDTCFCLESTVGLTGIFVGIGLLLSGIRNPITMTPAAWGIALVSVGTFGFIIKDYVVRWSPWAIAKDKDHLNLVVRL